MVCPNCNSTVNSDAVFCRNCGSKLVVSESELVVNVPIVDNGENNNLNISQNQQEKNSNIGLSNQQINISFDDLVDAYIGKKSDKLKNGFSFCTLFFGVLYVFYRKMWSLGFIWILINVFLSAFLPCRRPFL